MRQCSARSGSRLSTIGACEQTTGRRTPISRYGAENENCSGSNHPDQPNVSSPFMPPHSTHSLTNVICCADRISRSFAPLHSALGPRHPLQHEASCPLHFPRVNADNVTKPAGHTTALDQFAAKILLAKTEPSTHDAKQKTRRLGATAVLYLKRHDAR